MQSIRAAFSRLLGPKVLEDVLQGRAPATVIKTTRLSCLLFHVADATADEIRQHIERAVPICVKHDGIIMDIMASILFVVFGMYANHPQESVSKSRTASEEMLRSLGSSIRIVSFYGDIAHGIVGQGQGRGYTALVPKFDIVLSALLRAKFGRATEMGGSPWLADEEI